jgi:hypothetical protein
MSLSSERDVFGEAMTPERFRVQMLSKWLFGLGLDLEKVETVRKNVLLALPNVNDQDGWLIRIATMLGSIKESQGDGLGRRLP